MREHEDTSQEEAPGQERVLERSFRSESSVSTLAGTRPPIPVVSAGTLLSMQRLAGNAAVARWLSGSTALAPRTKTDVEPAQALFLQREEDDESDRMIAGAGSLLDEEEGVEFEGSAEFDTAPLPGVFLQRDDDGAMADASAGGPADAQQPSADQGMTPDLFSGMFDTDTLAQEVANLNDSELGAGDLAPGAPQSQGIDDGTVTAQAIGVQALSLQRDPPPAGADPNQPQTKPASAGDAIKAVSQLPEVKQGLDQLKQKALIDWRKLVNDPIGLSVSLPISVMIAAGAIGGIESNPGARRTVNPLIFGQDIPIPVPDSVGGGKLPGLSFKILGSGPQANGLVFTLDFGKVLGWKPPQPATPQPDVAGAHQ